MLFVALALASTTVATGAKVQYRTFRPAGIIPPISASGSR